MQNLQEAGTNVQRTSNVPTIHHNVPIYQTSSPQVRRYDVGAPSGITISLPGAESQDAERRRQIALRALSGQSISPQDANAIIEPTESLKGLLKNKFSPLEIQRFVCYKIFTEHDYTTSCYFTACCSAADSTILLDVKLRHFLEVLYLHSERCHTWVTCLPF